MRVANVEITVVPSIETVKWGQRPGVIPLGSVHASPLTGTMILLAGAGVSTVIDAVCGMASVPNITSSDPADVKRGSLVPILLRYEVPSIPLTPKSAASYLAT
jgi:hypothetical protein